MVAYFAFLKYFDNCNTFFKLKDFADYCTQKINLFSKAPGK